MFKMHDLFVLLMRKGNRFLNFNYFRYYFYYYLLLFNLSSHFSRKDYNCKKSCVLFLYFTSTEKEQRFRKKLHKFDFTNV